MKIVENETFDQERAYYGCRDVSFRDCAVDGPADGESAFKESTGVEALRCYFNLRYPFWHDHGLHIADCEMTQLCRAALWYSDHIRIERSRLHGIKALRECADAVITDSDIVSPEFGWSTRGVRMADSSAESEYFMMRAEDLRFERVRLKGKYSFQYIRNGVFEDCVFDTKDAFWHAENVVVRNSIVKGEYLAWYSDGLTLENCRIEGTQPFCYCRNLRLIDCEMISTDRAFEKSDVDATVTTRIDSVKNPRAGRIIAPEIGELILDDPEAGAEIRIPAQDGQR